MSEQKGADNKAQIADADTFTQSRKRKRRWWLRILILLVLVAITVWGVYYFMVARFYVSTNDAYVNGNIVEITPRITGTVTQISVDDNDYVERGQTLVTLDHAKADVALESARAALGQAVRKVSGLYSTAHTSEAQVDVRKSALRQARSDYQRRQKLAASGAISHEELVHAEDAYISAKSSLAAAKATLATAEAQINGTDVAGHPDVKAAISQLRDAWLDDQRTLLPAPVSGYVAKRNVQLGQHVDPGTALMAVVPLDNVWVDANFKETQLRHMRIGQKVTLEADLYGSAVAYHGQVEGLGIGTGSAFSLLPAQNATGNWIKIVQRLPVRIKLDKDELDKHPLRIGLSMQVKVNLHDDSGQTLATSAHVRPELETQVFNTDARPLETMIHDIIATNSQGVGKQQSSQP